MAARKRRPKPQDAGPGDSHPEVRAREPEPFGGATEPPRTLAHNLAEPFAARWEDVTTRDVLAVISIAVAACRIAAIIVPLFMGNTMPAFGQHKRLLLRASRLHWPDRSDTFHNRFVLELAEYLYSLPDNGVSRREVSEAIAELQGQWNS